MTNFLGEIVRQQARIQADLNDTLRAAQASRECELQVLENMAQVSRDMANRAMFANIPHYDGKEPEALWSWMNAIENAANTTRQPARMEALARATGLVHDVIMSIPADRSWTIVKRHLIKSFTSLKTEAHAIMYLSSRIQQKPDESLRIYIYRYTNMYKYAYPGVDLAQVHDSSISLVSYEQSQIPI